jgi:hypothetical protein
MCDIENRELARRDRLKAINKAKKERRIKELISNQSQKSSNGI